MVRRVVLASDAEQALENVAVENFDAVLIDFDTGDMNGAELARRVRALAADRDRTIHLLMVSGHPASRALGSEMVDGWLQKPLSQATLKAALESGIPHGGD